MVKYLAIIKSHFSGFSIITEMAGFELEVFNCSIFNKTQQTSTKTEPICAIFLQGVAKILSRLLKQNQIKIFFKFFRFKCHYFKTGGRKHPVSFKNENSLSNLYENRKKLLKSVQ